MASNPIFAATPNVNHGTTPATAITSFTSGSGGTTVFTAGANGSKVEAIRINQVLTTSGAGYINIFLYDGTNYSLFDNLVYAAGTISTTVETQPVEIYYNSLVLKTGWSIIVGNTVASGTGTTAATHRVMVFGADF